jgi:hypothetical protein
MVGMSTKVDNIQQQTNGMSHRLEEVARSQGVAQGRAEEKASREK